MSINKNLIKLVYVFLKSRWYFFKPKHSEVLIYDRNGAELILNFLDKPKCFVYDSRGESINIFIIIITILKYGLKNLKFNYKKTYFGYIDPTFIITYMDNYPAFYLLKNIKKSAITIFIQSTYRNKNELNVYDSDGKKNKQFKVDYMLTFGDAVGEKYSQMIDGKYISMGNLINNDFHFSEKIEKKSLVFISQFKTGRIFPKNEKIILRLLKRYCSNKNLKLYVCTKIPRSDDRGIEAFSKILGKNGWNYCPRDNGRSSYERVFKSEFVVFADSTLGYEALSRKKKTAALPFGCKIPDWCKKNTAHQIISFGFPLNFSDVGPFWSNIYKKKVISKILDYITEISDAEWYTTLKNHQLDKLMQFDQGNQKLLNLFKKLKLPLKKNI